MIDHGPDRTRGTTFIGGDAGAWSVTSQLTYSGASIATVPRIDVVDGVSAGRPPGAAWALSGMTTNDRYTTRSEKSALLEKQAPIGRPDATCAALILLRKNARWWALSQDERRDIFEGASHHIAIGLRYLPGVARRLFHCRDLGAEAPFDFLGFLDYAPASAAAFDDMLAQLRASVEWTFMEREIDIRLTRSSA